MNYDEALEYIHSLQIFGSIPGLERISQLLSKLGNPQDKLKFIHVAGTNGKGSTCTMLSEIFCKAGYKTGLYTSPFVIDFRERICFCGEYIEKEILAELCEEVMNTGITVTEFEFITALAMLYFLRKQCDIVILETGLGGRFDATNVIKAPLVSVITKIDYDHTAYLGDTLSKIAMEKCGIIKDDCPTVSYPLQEKEALYTIKHYAKNLTVPSTDMLEIKHTGLDGNTFIYKGTEYTTKLIGEHQVYNAVTAIETVNASGINIPDSIMQNAIANTKFPARMEIISKSPLLILDGAHNPDGAKALAGVLGGFSKNIVAVIGMMADKNCDDFLKATLPFCKSVITVEVKENPRSISATDLAEIALKYCKDVYSADSYDEALTKAKLKSEGNMPIFVFGSLYLAGAIRDKLISAF